MLQCKKSKLATTIIGLCALPMLLQVANAQAAQVSGLKDSVSPLPAVPTDTITIYNDSPETIYPVIGTAALSSEDSWLKAYFSDSNAADTYDQSNIYRIYVNVQNGQVQGIAPNQSATVTVPFYNALESSPQPSGSNQYADWWNGGQIYVYDQQSNVQAAYNLDVNGHSPVQLYGTAPSISVCDSSGANCNVVQQNFYAADTNSSGGAIGLPLNDPYQLAEYTFGQLNGNSIDTTKVDYDVSYVNSLYLPMAIEPAGDSIQGYTGTTESVSSFRNVLINWLTKDPNGQNWPVFSNVNGGFSSTNPKIPSSNYIWTPGIQLSDYNDSGSTDIATIQKQEAAVWNYCIDPTGYPLTGNFPTPPSAECQDINTIYPLFEQSYVGAYGHAPTPPSQNNLLGDVYGFNAVMNGSNIGTFPQTTADADKPADNQLEYSYQSYGTTESPLPAQDVFDPYVQLIHGTAANDLNIPYVYAFPYDDNAGNNEPIQAATGLIITVGGGTQLPNPNPSIPTPATLATVMLGASASGPTWNEYGVGTATPNQTFTTPNSISIPVGTSFPCTISISDSNNNLYQFTLTQQPPFTKQNITQCSGPNGWCSGVQIASQGQNIATPPPGN